MTFVIDISQYHCKNDHKKAKWNKMVQDTCKSDSVFHYLQISTLFKWILKFISWSGLSQKWIIIVL